MPTLRIIERPQPGLDDRWEYLPFRFERWNDGSVFLTNLVGEHEFVSAAEFAQLAERRFEDDALIRRLRAKHLIRLPDEPLPVRLLAMKLRTQHRRLANFTSLHMFVVTLRCEHSCAYCQVSRQNTGKREFDMTPETARKAVDLAFRSPSPDLKIEFQGGEPLLNFPAIRNIVEAAETVNRDAQKRLAFVIASNLAVLDDEMLEFAEEHEISFSTSLDGPADLHNRNRPRAGLDSWERTLDGIARIRGRLGQDRVSALMTTTTGSLARVREIVDAYLENGFREIFLRPISPYGFAVRRGRSRYDTNAWIKFYAEGLDYILALNRRGIPITETYAAIVLKKMLTNDDSGYVDLTSPAGLGIKALLYNYDGDVYASDEGRMLAEMRDSTFRLGNVSTNSYEEIITSPALLDPLEESFTWSVPGCDECAFERYCGADPVFHHAVLGDPVGRKAESPFCTRNMAVFKLLLDRYRADAGTRELFHRWASR